MKTCSNCEHWKRWDNSDLGDCTAPIPMWVVLSDVGDWDPPVPMTYETEDTATCAAFVFKECYGCDDEDCPRCDGLGGHLDKEGD